MPLDLGHVTLQYISIPAGMPAPSMGLAPYLVVEFLSYVLSWTLFPFVMMYLVRLLQRPRALFLVHGALQLAAAAAVGPDLQREPARRFPRAAGCASRGNTSTVRRSAAFFIYGTFIAGVGLQVGIGTGLSLVVLDFILGEITGQLIMENLGPPKSGLIGVRRDSGRG